MNAKNLMAVALITVLILMAAIIANVRRIILAIIIAIIASVCTVHVVIDYFICIILISLML